MISELQVINKRKLLRSCIVVLFLIFLQLSTVHCFFFPLFLRASTYRRGKVGDKTSSTSLNSKTSAQPSEESIGPTYYQTDLYAVLGVNRTASRTELKEAYWNIAASNHPDRNNVQISLKSFSFLLITYFYRVFSIF